MPETICVILTGGQSRRMGRDKAMLPLGTGSFLSSLAALYSKTLPVYISVAEAGRFPVAGVFEIPDLHPGKGPLAGLEASFLQTGAERVFLTATDLPFGSPALALELLGRIGDHDACVIRRSDGRAEPLFAVYSSKCLPQIIIQMEKQCFSVRDLLDHIRVEWVEESELSGYDLDHILYNVNTPEDYQNAMDQLLGHN